MRLEATRRSDLAVRALTALGGMEGRVKAPELAELLNTTPAFITQVVGQLVKAGWVRSDPGPSGGYSLSTDLSTLTVLGVVEAVDGEIDNGRCVVEARACGATSPCVMHLAWSRARAELVNTLGAMPLSEVPAIDTTDAEQAIAEHRS